VMNSECTFEQVCAPLARAVRHAAHEHVEHGQSGARHGRRRDEARQQTEKIVSKQSLIERRSVFVLQCTRQIAQFLR